MNNLRYYYLSGMSKVSPRAGVLKVKINGLCVNDCSFCPFNKDPSRLSVDDLEKFFAAIDKEKHRRIIISGGEPTICRNFLEITDCLKRHWQDKAVLCLASNTIPLAWSDPEYAPKYRKVAPKYAKILDRVCSTFQEVAVGCDDEHRNIGALETVAPIFKQAGIHFWVNSMKEYCSDEVRNRILALKKKYGMGLFWSDVHHYHEKRKKINDLCIPCHYRDKDFLLNSDGNAYFCFKQEHKAPLFNLHTATAEEIRYYLYEHDPKPYTFCEYCPIYKPSLIDRGRALVGRKRAV